MIDLSLLQDAIAVAECGSYVTAAKRLNRTPPTLSRRIMALEASLGVRLFDRGRAGAVPTPFGRLLLDRSGRLIADVADLERGIAQMRGIEAGTLMVGVGVYPAYLTMGTTVGRLIRKYPGLRVVVRSGDWRDSVAEVLAGSIDLAVAELSGLPEASRLAIEPLPQHRAVLFCRADHPLLAEHRLTFERAFEFPFAGTRLPPRIGEPLAGLCRGATLDPLTGDFLPPIEINTLRMAMEAVAASDAIGIATPAALADRLATGQLAILPIRSPWMHTNYGFVHLKDRTQSPAALAFMREFRAAESEIVEQEPQWGAAARTAAAGRRTYPGAAGRPDGRRRPFTTHATKRAALSDRPFGSQAGNCSQLIDSAGRTSSSRPGCHSGCRSPAPAGAGTSDMT